MYYISAHGFIKLMKGTVIKMLNVALTFDYELFFGENYGTSDEILFTPTGKLLDLLDKYNVKATFFADVLSVYMHEKYGLNDYCDRFTAQIKDMISRGHDVQLHIHSHWLKSTYENGKWIFDTDSYKLHSFGFDDNSEFSVRKIIVWGKKYLEDSLIPVKSSYKCVSFRAGGYGIQPHKELFTILHENGIFIDSSVSLNQKSSGINSYDFTTINKLVGWWAPINGELGDDCSDRSNAMFEVPIGSVKNSLFRRLFSPKTERSLSLKHLRGTYIGSSSVDKSVAKPEGKIKRVLRYGKAIRRLSFDSINYALLTKAIVDISQKYKGSSSFISLIGHPKLIEQEWLNNFESLLIEICKMDDCKPITMQDIGNSI